MISWDVILNLPYVLLVHGKQLHWRNFLIFLLNCLLLLLVFAIVLVCSEVVGLENSNSVNTYNTFGLGKNVNIAKDMYLDENSLNSGRCIFDQNWFLERINDENTIINNPSTQSYVNVSSGNSINSLMVSLNNKFKFGSSAAISDIGTDKFLSFTLQNKLLIVRLCLSAF